jgi:hypothetical protein
MLLLFSNDGAERFDRYIEFLLQAHAHGLLGIDGCALGICSPAKGEIKLVTAEHQDVVSEALRTMIA